MPSYGRETIVLVEIDQPLCVRQWGDAFASPTPEAGCHAVLGVDDVIKCFNTRFTCPVPDDYSAGTLTLRFGKKQLDLTRYYGYVIPSYLAHSTTPGAINLAAMYDSAAALGQREVVTISFQDHRHSDFKVDPYRLERQSGAAMVGSPAGNGYDPYTRGTFWGKWLARNPYYAGYALRIYEGFLGDAIEDMRVRHYVIDRIEGPANGEVRIVAKDTFTRLEARKAVAPPASRGELGSNINSGSSSATLSPTGIGDEDYPYLPGSPSEMYLAIGDEIVKATRSADTLSLAQRGAFGTEPDDHNDEDLVQWVLVYEQQGAHLIIYDLLVNYGGIDPAQIDLDEWELQAVELDEVYSAVIAEPTPIQQLVGELCQQAGLTVWHDPATNMINLRALRASNSIATITDDGWIIADSLRTKRQDERRVSQVWVYYGQKNPMERLEEPSNFYSRVVCIDPDAEGEDQYGSPKVQRVFSRWIKQFGRTSALETGSRILSIFRDPPIEARFSVDSSRDETLALARFVTIETADVQDPTGDVEDAKQYAVVSLERSDGQVHVVAQQVTFASVPGDGGVAEDDPRSIFIENDTTSINLRTIHDSLYDAPTGGSPSQLVTFTNETGVYIYSTSTSTPAVATGTWPAGVDVKLVNNGYIMGKGGNGGSLGDGQAGGNAIEISHPLIIDNTNGYILGGGGGGAGNSSGGLGGGGAGGGNGGTGGLTAGGAGGGIGVAGSDGATVATEASGAGGGGRIAVGTGGAGCIIVTSGPNQPIVAARGGQCGGGGGGVVDDGTNVTGGAGGNNTSAGGAPTSTVSSLSWGIGGGGGGWGEAGGAGLSDSGPAGSGGAAGKAINLNGNSVTWLGGSASPQVRGAVS